MINVLGYVTLSPQEVEVLRRTNTELQDLVSSGAVEDINAVLLKAISDMDWAVQNLLGDNGTADDDAEGEE